MPGSQSRLITNWRLLNAGLLIADFLMTWVFHDQSADDSGLVVFVFWFYLPALLVGAPFVAIFTISAFLALGYIVLDIVTITRRTFGWGNVVLLLGILGGLLAIFTWLPSTRIGPGYWLTMATLGLSLLLEITDQLLYERSIYSW